MKYYTGIGSRETPEDIQITMKGIAEKLYNLEYILRSGGADGADRAFEYGHDDIHNLLDSYYKHYSDKFSEIVGFPGMEAKIRKEIYIPWNGFSNKNFHMKGVYCLHENPDDESYEAIIKATQIVKRIHPAPKNLSLGAWKLHTRNCFQVLGKDLNTPSEFVICWTKNGDAVGGTRTAIVLARENNIPVYNLFFKEDINKVESLIKGLEDAKAKDETKEGCITNT